MNIIFEKITKDNLELACKIQNEIFPEEDGTQNFIECVEKDPYRKELDFYIVYDDNLPIGVSGIYSYNEYPEDSWLGWYGILPKLRNKGYGNIVFDKTVELAQNKGYKTLRIYSEEIFTDAHRLYKKKGMIQEVYDREDYEGKEYKTIIFSMSLTDEKIDYWNNKFLGLEAQREKENNKN